jgi:hypothetical protein
MMGSAAVAVVAFNLGSDLLAVVACCMMASADVVAAIVVVACCTMGSATVYWHGCMMYDAQCCPAGWAVQQLVGLDAACWGSVTGWITMLPEHCIILVGWHVVYCVAHCVGGVEVGCWGVRCLGGVACCMLGCGSGWVELNVAPGQCIAQVGLQVVYWGVQQLVGVCCKLSSTLFMCMMVVCCVSGSSKWEYSVE